MKNYHAPDEKGFFGEHGGLYVSETLIPALKELEQAYNEAKNDPEFWAEFRRDLK
ncbi:tryptophan synthase subunit beta, partial [Neisseria gonorrhoeae]